MNIRVLVVPVLLLAACGGEKTPDEQARANYMRACALCHAADGSGAGNLGNSLLDNEFIRTKSDAELVAFLKAGRAPGDPDNESGMPMPPRGGDPRLTDDDLAGIVAYMRTLSP